MGFDKHTCARTHVRAHAHTRTCKHTCTHAHRSHACTCTSPWNYHSGWDAGHVLVLQNSNMTLSWKCPPTPQESTWHLLPTTALEPCVHACCSVSSLRPVSASAVYCFRWPYWTHQQFIPLLLLNNRLLHSLNPCMFVYLCFDGQECWTGKLSSDQNKTILSLDILERRLWDRRGSGQGEGCCEGNHSRTDLWEMQVADTQPRAFLDCVKLTKATVLRKQTKHIFLLLLF